MCTDHCTIVVNSNCRDRQCTQGPCFDGTFIEKPAETIFKPFQEVFQLIDAVQKEAANQQQTPPTSLE